MMLLSQCEVNDIYINEILAQNDPFFNIDLKQIENEKEQSLECFQKAKEMLKR